MDEKLKRRLVGAVVLVSLAVIFVPMLLEEEPVVVTGITGSNIPPRPSGEEFVSRIQPLATPVPQIEPITRVEEPESQKSTPGEASASTATPSAWVVQVASFGKQENAAKLVQRLRKKGFPAFSESVVIEGETLFRVRVGPEADRKRTDKMRADIEKSFDLKARVKRYP